jgi:acyl-coenzyme A thioesterase PaaI-like protein
MIAAVPHGSVLQAIGKVRKAGKTVIFTDAEVWCENRLVGQAKGTFVNHGPVEYK